jgi:hypothetical protein
VSLHMKSGGHPYGTNLSKLCYSTCSFNPLRTSIFGRLPRRTPPPTSSSPDRF